MIRSLTLVNPKKTPIKWLGNVEALKEPKTFEFKPGLNILWGPNGSGKSTILKLLARLFHCEQSGRSVVTQESVSELFSTILFEQEKKDTLFKSIRVDHDGQGVWHFDPQRTVGLIGGGAGFDYDFFSEGVRSIVVKGSSGQITIDRLGGLMTQFLEGKRASPIEYRIKKDSVNDQWAHKISRIEKFLKGDGEKGKPTWLLDEPERSLDLPLQAKFWGGTIKNSTAVQLIVASHSPFALGNPDANYIEMTPGYLKASMEAMESRFGRCTSSE